MNEQNESKRLNCSRGKEQEIKNSATITSENESASIRSHNFFMNKSKKQVLNSHKNSNPDKNGAKEKNPGSFFQNGCLRGKERSPRIAIKDSKADRRSNEGKMSPYDDAFKI